MLWPFKNKDKGGTTRPAPVTLDHEDGTLRTIEPDAIIRTHGDLYRKLRKETDFHPDQIPSYYDDLILELSRYCHSLPASQHGQFRQPAGLLGQCLRTAFVAHRIAHGKTVSYALPADARAHAERSWRYTAMLTGLVYPMAILAHLGAKGMKTGRIWRVEAGPLTEWLGQNQETRYQPYWNPRPGGATDEGHIRVWILSRLLNDERYRFITKETDQFLNEMMAVLTGIGIEEDSLLSYVMDKALQDTLRQEMASTTTEIRGLWVEDGYERLKDVINLVLQEDCGQETTPIRSDGNSLYGIWPQLANRIKTAASKHNIVGLPEDEKTLLDQLGESGILSPDEGNGWLHQVVPMEKGMSMLVDAVQFNLRLSSQMLTGFPMVERHEDLDVQQVDDSPQPPVEDVSTVDDWERGELIEESDLFEDLPPQEEPAPMAEVPEESSPTQKKTARVTPAKPKPPRKPNNKPRTTPAQANAADKGGKRQALNSSRLSALREVAPYLARIDKPIETLGWWTDKGRALPWPDIAEMSGSKPPEFLKALKESGVAIRSSNKHLPFIHEFAVEGKPAMAIVIGTEYWPGEAKA